MIKTSIAIMLVLGYDGGSRLIDFGNAESDIPVSAAVAPYENADAGVFEVREATTFSGITLGEGWWHSRERQKKLGTALIDKDNKLAECQRARDPEALPTWAVVLTVAAVSFAGGVALTLFAIDKK